MEELLLDILGRLRRDPSRALGAAELDRVIRAHNRGVRDNARHLSKRQVLPYYLRVRDSDPERWASWDVDADLERRLVETLRLKPRRTASGVATVTVLTRPAPCSGSCVFCPNDVRMPKSYLHREPACRRAEQGFFDPYLQVHARLRALSQMGHPTDKVELIVLGGTWSDYPRAYQVWFVRELFRAVNDWPDGDAEAARLRALYRAAGLTDDAEAIAGRVRPTQELVDAGELTYNEAVRRLWGAGAAPGLRDLVARQAATGEELAREHARNEGAAHRVVGLVVETRPDAVTPEGLRLLRELGCTKVQVGVQSTRAGALDANGRGTSPEEVRRAFALIRLYGFKIHSHLMLNLVGSTPELDRRDFSALVSDPALRPDEVKLYPCALVPGTRLVGLYERGAWAPYTVAELVDVLVADVLATPPYMRISRMIRDIGADDILVGNKHANLRQLVDERIVASGLSPRVREIRYREIARSAVDLGRLELVEVPYETDVTRERFLEWVTPEGRIAGFLRLSLPRGELLRAEELATRPGDAMVREVHVYGEAAHLGRADAPAQHQGLGRALVERAARIAGEEGYAGLCVVSSVGTRGYYRRLGFVDDGLYQRRDLAADPAAPGGAGPVAQGGRP
jgi:elongator complex protein 3